jgi:hypothetical protein
MGGRRDIIRWALDWLGENRTMPPDLERQFECAARTRWGGAVNRPWKTRDGRPGRPSLRSKDETRQAFNAAVQEALATRLRCY